MNSQEQIYKKAITDIEKQLNTKYFGTLKKSGDLINYINAYALKHLGIEGLSVNEPEMFEQIYNYIKPIVKELNSGVKTQSRMNTESVDKILKNVLTETSFTLPSPKIITNYEDEDAVKAIRKVIGGMKGFTLLTIQKNDGGQFFNVDVSVDLGEEVGDDLELRRFYLAQTLAKFRGQVFTELSEYLPIVNVNTAAYDFSKNSEDMKFAATILVGNTNIHDWVTGEIKKPGKPFKENVENKKKNSVKEGNRKSIQDFVFGPDVEVFDKVKAIQSKGLKNVQANVVNSNTVRVKWLGDYTSDQILSLMENTAHLVKAMPLATAISEYKHETIDREMLETAIKACNRQELERFVLSQLGVKLKPDINDPGKEGQDGEERKDESPEGVHPAIVSQKAIAPQKGNGLFQSRY